MMMMIPVIFLSDILFIRKTKKIAWIAEQLAPVHLLTYFSLPSLSLFLSILCDHYLLDQ
jgi:hypothetical protein